MDCNKNSRAAAMAATYGDKLVQIGVLEQQEKEVSRPALQQQIIRGEVNWWMVCLGQSQIKGK